MGMGIKHKIGNGNGREWEITSVGMGIACTAMGIYSQKFYVAMSLLSYLPDANAYCAEFADHRNVIYSAPRAGLCMVIIND